MEAAQSRGINCADFYCTGGSIACDHVAVGGMLELQLSGCHHVSDNVFTQLARLTPSLQSFRVSGCHNALITGFDLFYSIYYRVSFVFWC